MCSWCWGFKPTMEALLEGLDERIGVKYLLGGLAVDSDEPMPLVMQHTLQQTWRQIAAVVPGTRFNFDFWSDNQPIRSTWPACRAVIAARQQDSNLEKPMITAIQNAYYLQAMNPSNSDTLIALAGSIGCDQEQFAEDLHSEATRQLLTAEISKAHQLGVRGFPSLVLMNSDQQYVPIAVDYNNARSMLDQIEQMNVA